MGAFFIYILKSAVCLVLFYLFFKLLLSRETFHRFNRVALLGVLLFSLLIPCIEMTTRHQVEVQQAVLSIEQLLMKAEMENTTPVEIEAGEWQLAPAPVFLSWIQIALLIYLAGIVVLVCRNVYSLLCLLRLICSGKREKLESGITLVVHDRAIAPFSWMIYIVISREDLEENDSWAAQRQKMNQKEEWIIIKNTHEALVSRKDFDEVQEKIGHIVKRVNEARKSNGNNVRDFNFFKQKIVCADCGKTMYLYGKTKGNHRRFYCGNNKLHGKCTPHSITDLEVNDYVLRVIRVHINVYVENVDLIRRLNQRQESIKKYDVFNREIKKCRKELEKVAVHRERLFEDYVCRIIDAEQYETFSKQDAETEKEIQNNMEILLKHQVGYEKNFHTEEEWETLINKYRNTRTLTKEMVNAFVEKIEIHESGSITVRLVYDDMLEELRKYAKEREAESCQ